MEPETLKDLGHQPSTECRKSRLWLGYSDDNLRNRDNVGTRPLQGHLDRPVPVSNDPASGDKNKGHEARLHSKDSRRLVNSCGNNDGDYVNPESYKNLDEVAVPAPVASRQKEGRQEYLEDRRNEHGSAEDNLVELAVTSPSANQKNHGYHLSGSPSSEEHAKQVDSPSHKRVSKHATEIYTVSYLIFFSILGTLARLGLQALTLYPGAPVQTGLLWANVGGSLIMGFLSEDRQLFCEEWRLTRSQRPQTEDEENPRRQQRSPSEYKEHAAFKKTLPLYIGLTTGFCGSFTSFSSFMRDAFFALSNALKVPISHPSSAPISETINVPRNRGYGFLAVLAVLITTIGLSLIGLQFGAHTALFLESFNPTFSFLFARRILDRLFVLVGWGCWLAAILMAILPPDRPGGPVGDADLNQETWRSQVLFALVFAPVGCLFRFYASLHLNGRVKSFPLGTFAVNMFGSAMEATFLDLQRVPVGGIIGCQVLQGMSDGFCGCLTTVSTWVAELAGLRLRHAYIYGLTSVCVALSLMIVIVGSLQWTVGFKDLLCMA